MRILKCPRCHCTRSWAIRRGKRRCCICKYEWRSDRLPLYLTGLEWNRLLRKFLNGQSAVEIALELNLGREQVLRALKLVRESLLYDMPQEFVSKIDPIYLQKKLGGQRKGPDIGDAEQSYPIVKRPVFGLLHRNGYIWAEIIPDVEAETFLSMLNKEKLIRIPYCLYLRTRYSAVATKEYFQRLDSSEQWNYYITQVNYVDELEHFWRYLKGMFKRGIRKGYLSIYLAEFIWRYNHRNLSISDQIKSILSLLQARYI